VSGALSPFFQISSPPVRAKPLVRAHKLHSWPLYPSVPWWRGPSGVAGYVFSTLGTSLVAPVSREDFFVGPTYGLLSSPFWNRSRGVAESLSSCDLMFRMSQEGKAFSIASIFFRDFQILSRVKSSLLRRPRLSHRQCPSRTPLTELFSSAASS